MAFPAPPYTLGRPVTNPAGATMRILCVCLGNICRSPMAEGAVRRMAAEAGLDITVDSAGLGPWHAGEPPNPRGLKVAAARGYDNSAQRARQVTADDFSNFDLIVAMDHQNLARLKALQPQGTAPEIRLFDSEGRAIPDPYDGDISDYEHALDMVEHAARDLVARLRA